MKLNQSIVKELRYVAVSLGVIAVVICAAFAALHRLDYTVILGALWGSVFAFLNVWLLARRVQQVSESSEEERKLAQNQLRRSYFSRMMLMAFAIVVGIIAPFFHYIAVLLPFLVPQPVMMLRRAVTAKHASHKQQTKEEDR